MARMPTLFQFLSARSASGRCGALASSLLVLALLLGALAVRAEGPAADGPGASVSAATCPPEPQPVSRALMQRARELARDRGFLWRLHRDGRVSYLYGTMHAGRAEGFALGPTVEAALYRTGQLALEVDVTDPAAMEAFAQALRGPARALPPALASALQAAWRAECLPPADLLTGPPELHATRLLMAHAQREGLYGLYGAESLLLMRSSMAQRPVTGLESVQTQLSALLARSDEEAQAMVSEALAERDKPRHGTLARLTQAWDRSDLQTIEAYPQWCECLLTEADRSAYERLVSGRNPGMAAAIERLHTQGPSVFAAVGALHVVGPQGLPALLQARGFQVERLF